MINFDMQRWAVTAGLGAQTLQAVRIFPRIEQRATSPLGPKAVLGYF